MANGNNRGNALRITAMSAALLMAYGPVHAALTTLSFEDGGAHDLKDSPYTGTFLKVLNAGTKVDGSKVSIDGPKLEEYPGTSFLTNGFIEVTKGGNLSLSNNSTVTATVTGPHLRTFWVDGDGSSLSLTDTTVISNTGSEGGTPNYSTAGVMVYQGGVANIKRGSVSTNGEKHRALVTTQQGAISADGVQVSTSGNGSHAVAAVDSGTIAISNSTVITTGDNAIGIQKSEGGGGSISGSNNTVTTSGAGSAGVSVEGPGEVTLTGAVITTNGTHSHGVIATSSGKVSLSGGLVTTANTKGQKVQDGDGARSYALYADGAGSSIVTQNGTNISTQGQRSYGAHAINGGSIQLNGGSIETHGFMAYGAYASGTNSTVSVTNVNITTTGDVGDAVWAYDGGKVTVTGGSINLVGDPNSKEPHESAGGLVATGGLASTIDATNVTINTRGTNSAGARAGSSNLGAGTINLNNVAITTVGDESEAAWVGYGGVLSIKDSTLVSVKDTGILVRGKGDVTIANSSIETPKGASLTSSFKDASKQTITVKSGSHLTKNDGTLLLVKRETGEGEVTLKLEAGTFASGNIVNHDEGGKLVDNDPNKTVLDFSKDAHWAGIVVGTKDKIVEEGSSQTYGNVDGNVVPATNSTVTFTPGAQVNGSVSAAQGSTTTFAGDSSITGSVANQGGTMVFGGNTHIGSSVTATQGSSFSFGGTTQIGQAGSSGTALAGQNASFGFSRTAPTTIHGNVVLTQGSSISGGSSGTPVQIMGNTSVNDGALLGGNLIITGQLNAQGGVVSPGNSIGTVRVGSVASFPSTYAVEVNGAGASDLMIIDSGDVDLSASALTVGQENGNGGYVLNHDYTIIQMPGNTASTEFKSATLNDSFAGTLVKLEPVKYSKTDVKIVLSTDASKIDAKRAGLTANQNATLDGVISVAGKNASADAALLSTDTGAALNQLSGELHASTQSALLNSSSLLTTTIAKRMRGNVGAGMMAGAPVAQSSGAMPAGAMPSSAAYPLWAQVVGNWSSLDGNNNAAKVKSDTAGLFIGGDVGVGQGWRLGATLGFTDGKIKVDDRSSRSDVRSYTAAIYGGNSWATAKGSVNFLAGAGYTRHDVDSRRTVTIGGNQTLNADYKANTTHLFTELGYAMPVGQASVVEPYLGLAWISQRAKGFDESGGSAALRGQSQTDNVTTFTLGARGKTTVEAGRHEIRLSAGAGWRHAAGDVDASRKMSFIQGNGATFQIAGAPIAKNAAVVDLGAEMTVGKNAAMGLSYNGQFGNGNTDSTGSLYLKVRFK